MAAKRHFFPFGSFSIKDGSQIKFWEDTWIMDSTPREQYLALYNIMHHKGDTLTKVLETSPPSIMFRRDLFGEFHLTQGSDEFHWNLNENGK
jgi:hypothetical protein